MLTGAFSAQASSHAPDDAFQQALRFYQDENYKQAIKAFESVTAAHPNHSEYRRWLGRAYGRRAETMSKWKLLSALGLAKKTRLCFERAVELDPSNLEALQDLFEFYLQAPSMIGGGLKRAGGIADKIMALDEAAGEGAWAAIDEKRGRHADAEKRLRRAHRLDPADLDGLLALASFQSRRGATPESDQLYAKAFRRHPDSPELWLSRAKTLLGSGREKAKAHVLLKALPGRRPRSRRRAAMGSAKIAQALVAQVMTVSAKQTAPQTRFFRDALGFAVASIRAHKTRSLLTALSMVVANASVILVVSTALTGRDFVVRQIQGVGSNLVYAITKPAGTFPNRKPTTSPLRTSTRCVANSARALAARPASWGLGTVLSSTVERGRSVSWVPARNIRPSAIWRSRPAGSSMPMMSKPVRRSAC